MIKSPGISIKTTMASTKSSVGSNQSIAHSESPVKHAQAPKGNPGKIAIKPELDYAYKGAKAMTDGNNGVAMGSFTPHNARTTKSGIFPKHPFAKSDPSSCKTGCAR